MSEIFQTFFYLYQTVFVDVIQFEEDKVHYRKSDEGSSARTKIRQWNTDRRKKSQNHS